MEMKLTYKEISTLIEQKTGYTLSFSCGGPHMLRINYNKKVLIKTVSVGIDLTVERIEGADIYIAYSGSTGVEFLVRQALSFAKIRPIGEMLTPLDGNRIMLCLSKNHKTSTIFEFVDLEDIHFDEQCAFIQTIVK